MSAAAGSRGRDARLGRHQGAPAGQFLGLGQQGAFEDGFGGPGAFQGMGIEDRQGGGAGLRVLVEDGEGFAGVSCPEEGERLSHWLQRVGRRRLGRQGEEDVIHHGALPGCAAPPAPAGGVARGL